MSDKSALFYDTVPNWYRFHKTVNVARFQLSKVQSYVLGEYGEASTLEEVLQKSRYVEWLMNRMMDLFASKIGEANYLEVCKVPGEITLAFRKNIPPQQITELAQSVQKIIYKVTSGQLELAYAVTSATVAAYSKASNMDNVMDELDTEVVRNRYKSGGLIKLDFHNIGTDSWVSEPIKATSRLSRPATSEGGRRKPLMLVRADLDNLYPFLTKIKSVDRYNKVVNLIWEGLKGVTESNAFEEVLFVGREELCIAVVADQCYDIMSIIHDKLEKYFAGTPDLSGYTFGVCMAAAPVDTEGEQIHLLESFCWAEHLMGVAKKCSGKNSVAFASELKSVAITWKQCEAMGRLLKANRYKICNGVSERVYEVVPDPIALKEELLRLASGPDAAAIAGIH